MHPLPIPIAHSVAGPRRRRGLGVVELLLDFFDVLRVHAFTHLAQGSARFSGL